METNLHEQQKIQLEHKYYFHSGSLIKEEKETYLFFLRFPVYLFWFTSKKKSVGLEFTSARIKHKFTQNQT